MKKIIIIILLLPNIALAQCPPSESLVPCGGEGCECDFCDFFEMINRIIKRLLGRIVPAIAGLMIVVAGIMMALGYSGQTGPEMINRAKKFLAVMAVGLLVAYLAWIIISLLLMSVGLVSWTGLDNWWTVTCE